MWKQILIAIQQFIQQFFAFLSTPQGMILASLLVLLLVVLIVITIVATKRNSYVKIIEQFEQHVQSNEDGNIEKKLLRLKIIGQNNVVYQRAYEEHQGAYAKLKTDYQDALKKDLAAVNHQLEQKNYRLVSKGIRECQAKWTTYTKQKDEFYQQISTLIHQDEVLRNQDEGVRKQFKQARDIFANNQQDLVLVEESLAERISNINIKFDLFEQQVDLGNYDDASDYLSSIEKDVSLLFRALEELPRLCKIVTQYFPPRINGIIESCNQMQAEGYPMYHLIAGSKINKIKEDLTGVIEDLVGFRIEQLDSELSSIDERIKELQQNIDQEKTARKEYDTHFQNLYTKAEDLERAFIRYMGEITELNRIYDISKQAQEFSGKIKAQVNALSITRRALDSLNYSKQPYLMRYHKMKEMQVLALDLEKMMGNFKNEITNMKVISEDAYDLVGEAASRLKKLELRVRNFNLDKLTARYVRDIADGFELIDKLSRAISASPIQIKIVDELKMKLDALLRKIDERVKRDIAYGEYSEKLILYANNYRASFSDVESSVSKAEMLFFEARFEEAVDLVRASLNKLGELPIKRPDFEGSSA